MMMMMMNDELLKSAERSFGSTNRIIVVSIIKHKTVTSR